MGKKANSLYLLLYAVPYPFILGVHYIQWIQTVQHSMHLLNGGNRKLTQNDNECDIGCVTGLTSVEQASHSCTTDTATTEEAWGGEGERGGTSLHHVQQEHNGIMTPCN